MCYGVIILAPALTTGLGYLAARLASASHFLVSVSLEEYGQFGSGISF